MNKPSHWQKIRQEALKRAGHSCESCNVCPDQPRRLHCHHLTYERQGRELLEDVQVLCVQCHRAVHSGPRKDHYPQGSINLRVEENLKERCQDVADSLGLTLSAWIRMMMIKEANKEEADRRNE